MKMKSLLSVSLALTALTSCQEQKSDKPNILFILVDDMQSDAIAALGNKMCILLILISWFMRG